MVYYMCQIHPQVARLLASKPIWQLRSGQLMRLADGCFLQVGMIPGALGLTFQCLKPDIVLRVNMSG